MLKHLLVSYSKISVDCSNDFVVFARRNYPKTVILDNSVLKMQLNLIFRYLLWYKENCGRILFLVDASDLGNFSNFIFFCNILPNCEVQAMNSLTRLKINFENTLVVTLFLNDSFLDFIQQESKFLNFPLISFLYVNSNVYRSAYSIALSDNFYSKVTILNMLIVSLLSSRKNRNGV